MPAYWLDRIFIGAGVMGKSKGRLNVGIGVLIAGFLGLTSIIPIKLAIALQQYPEPQAILILDGNDQRVQFGATFARLHPELPVWISGYCARRAKVYQAFETAGVEASRVHYDLRATDTVTHFTTLVSDYVGQDIRHLYLVTSDFHMARAEAIAAIVFGSHGIAVTPVAESTHYTIWETQESWHKVGRDTIRSVIWLVTGRAGSRFNHRTRDNCENYGK